MIRIKYERDAVVGRADGVSNTASRKKGAADKSSVSAVLYAIRRPANIIMGTLTRRV
jgi:hypothetical protein